MICRRFVVVSGVPGSGKTTLARQLSPTLGLPVIDKDDILEKLFQAGGVGDATFRRTLSRESDLIFRAEAERSDGALLVSFWHQRGMALESGTSTDWLLNLPDCVVNVHCLCEPHIAAERFAQRKRHPGHLDSTRDYAEILATILALTNLEPLAIVPRIEVDTSGQRPLNAVVDEIEAAFSDCLQKFRGTGTFGP
jgi:cytidylate kinase